MSNKIVIKNVILTIFILTAAFVISLLFQHVFDIYEHITTLFVFAVFLISLFTSGYLYGMIAAILGTLAINFAFTFPFFAFNFTIPVNIISALVMITISFLTSTLTTKIKHSEAIKVESEKEKMRANLLRAVSHDLRTPLTAIYGSASMLIENGIELTENKKIEMIEGIKESSDWMIRMVENLLSVTRIESGKIKIIKAPTVIDELIDSVLTKFKKRFPQQNITFELPNKILVVSMDALLIEQVLINLLDNAVRHSVNATVIKLRVSEKASQVTFEIEDNGVGIPSEILPKIFDGGYEFKDMPADAKRKNAGIGLSVCATIIKAHNGKISAENKADGGTLFRFVLDLEEGKDE